jgi:hypothetical protein
MMAGEVDYTCSWLIGLEIHGMRRCASSATRGLDWGVGHEVQILDGDRYHRTTRTTTTVLQTDPFDVAATLIRPLLRNLGYEKLLDQTPGRRRPWLGHVGIAGPAPPSDHACAPHPPIGSPGSRLALDRDGPRCTRPAFPEHASDQPR